MESKQPYATGQEAIDKAHKRKRKGFFLQGAFFLSTVIAVLFLSILLLSIINDVIGYTVLIDGKPLSTLVEGTNQVKDLTREQLLSLSNEHISMGILRKLDYDNPLENRTDRDLVALVEEYVIQPEVLKTWGLWESLAKKSEIEAFIFSHEGSYLIFRNWITPTFFFASQSSNPLIAGIRTAFLGSMWILLVTFVFAFPFGIGAAIYLQEYAPKNRLTSIMQLNIFNLSAVPSIIYGLLGLAFFVRVLEPFTSGAFFSNVSETVANGRTILSGGLTLGLLVLPIIIINTQEAIKAVPESLRLSSYGVGATKWQTIWHHVLPASFSRILTGTILALSRALGETAPLVVIGASTFISVDPSGVFSKFTTLPIQIYQWSARPQGAYRNIAAAAIITLLVLLLVINSSAIIARERISRKKRLEA
ncbi:MAG: phosphate ABC transporter permease PstA [Spirochaetia bacterium]|nr:phosphate ABC transporter permease PstA [Spirochaetia bacterium]